MVVSKRCKICTALDADNIAISGEYYEKSLPVLIEKISGVQLDARKANGVLICKLCAVHIVHADIFIDKLRNTLQRLTKLVKETKPKTSSEAINANTDENKSKPKNLAVRRKSVFLSDSLVNSKDETKETVGGYGKLTPSKSNSKKDFIDSKKQEMAKADTLNKVVRNKPELEVENEVDNIENGIENERDLVEEEISKYTNLKPNEVNKEDVQQKTPKKVVRRKSVVPKESRTNNHGDLTQSYVEPKINSPTKFKKIADDELATVKSTPAKAIKRKQIFKENDVECGGSSFNNSDVCDSTPAKRYNYLSMSAMEGSSIDNDKVVQDFTRLYNESSIAEVKLKMLNCVICGKDFSQKSSLREHIESSHMGEKLKQCPNCSTEFRSQQKYESHVFSEKCKNSKHACQYPKCNKRFKTVHKMELHMQEKHFSSQQDSEVE